MTTIDTGHAHDLPGASATGAGAPGRTLAGATSWLTTTDHKQIGRLFVGSSVLFLTGLLVIGGLLGFERLDAESVTLEADSIGQLFSLYRIGLPYLVVGPLLFGLAIAIVPLQLGARALAFGRAAALGFWSWLFGAGLVVAAYLGNGGPGGGDPQMVELFLAGFGLSLLGLLVAAMTLVVSVLTARAPGMTLRRVPLFAWAALVGSAATIVTVPVLLGDLVLLTVDHRSSRSAEFGANSAMLGWFSWALTSPAIYVLAIPALGILADIAHTTSRRRLSVRPVLLTGIGLTAAAVLSAVTQKVHTLPWPGSFGDDFGGKLNDLIPYALFNLLPILGPLAVGGAVAATLAAAKPRHLPAALVFAFSGVELLTLGVAAHALTGVVDLQLLGTTYEEGVVVLVLGGAVLAGLGGLVHWGPKLWGRTLSNGGLLPLALLGALGVTVAGAALLIAGFQGQPAMAAGGFDYELAPEVLNVLVLVGHGLLLLCVVAVVLLAVMGFRKGPLAGDDPWDGVTLEWATSSPPPTDNFVEIPRISSGNPLLDLKPAGSDA